MSRHGGSGQHSGFPTHPIFPFRLGRLLPPLLLPPDSASFPTVLMSRVTVLEAEGP